MKKSEIYQAAMVSVIDDQKIDATTRLEIIAVLQNDKEIAEYTEAREEKEKEAVNA